MVLAALNWILGLFAVAVALAFGGKIERAGAVVLIVMIVVALVGRIAFQRVFTSVDAVSTLQDLLGFVGFAVLGITSKRVWPLWAAALQLLSVGAHLIRAFELAVRPIVYAWMKSGPTWGVFLLLLIGTAGHLSRTRRDASRTSWPG